LTEQRCRKIWHVIDWHAGSETDVGLEELDGMNRAISNEASAKTHVTGNDKVRRKKITKV
jgi:hypothetical protein